MTMKQQQQIAVVGVTEKRVLQVLEPEKENGNTEYKRQVHHASVNRLQKLATQMNYRLDQGQGRCIYQLGVEDDGCHSLLDYSSMSESARTLETLAQNSLNAVVVERIMIQNEVTISNDTGIPIIIPNVTPVQILEPPLYNHTETTTDEKKEDEFRKSKTKPGLFTRCQVTIQRVETHVLDPDQKTTSSNKNNNNKDSITETLASRNIRIAVVGNVDAGKSTLIGSLTTSCLDDGRGKSRTSIMKHRHEIESGRTSTASTHLLGFNKKGQPVLARDKLVTNKRKTEQEVVRESYRIVTLMDLAGHEKYFKTTVHGVSSGMADYALILVNSRHPPTHMTQHHLQLCCSFGIPVIIVFTKLDGCPLHAYKHSKKEVVKLLRAPDVAKKPFMIKTPDDISTCVSHLHALCPILETSSVTGHGMDLLQKLLYALPKRRRHERKVNRPFEFLVEDTFNVPGVGSVVSGFVNAGELMVGSQVFVGPTNDGKFLKTIAKSAHMARIHTSHVTAGQSACLALSLNKDLRSQLRRGMVVLKESPTCTKEFDAEICVLKGEGTTIGPSYQAHVHILHVRQTVYARNMELLNNEEEEEPQGTKTDKVVLRPGHRAKVRFEFASRPEYIRSGMRLLFRDGKVRGIGVITGIVIPNSEK